MTLFQLQKLYSFEWVKNCSLLIGKDWKEVVMIYFIAVLPGEPVKNHGETSQNPSQEYNQSVWQRI
jgi:radical SAM superfamily enzyme YgiQ (UPF0313 family)